MPFSESDIWRFANTARGTPNEDVWVRAGARPVRRPMLVREPTFGYAAREVAPGTFKFQAVEFVTTRNGTQMMKTHDPHEPLLTEQEMLQQGYDTMQLIDQARKQRIGLPQYQWRYHAIAWKDLWEEPAGTEPSSYDSIHQGEAYRRAIEQGYQFDPAASADPPDI